MKSTKPQHSVRKLIIDPCDITRNLLDEMHLDDNIRTLVVQLLKHGYDTWYTCEGHESSEPYIALKKGTGDGSFEREASQYGLKLKNLKPCCIKDKRTFCGQCGSSKEFDVYHREKNKPFMTYEAKK